MQTAAEAEEHLRVIRSLMEKATIYRAVSAPTALAGGIAAVMVALPPVVHAFDAWVAIASFQVRWLVALIVTLLVNGLLIYREALRRGDPLISAGMRAAFLALLPPMLCGGFFFAFTGLPETPGVLALFYGLGLLATGHFAPPSIVWLGWSFLIAGLAIYLAAFFDPSTVSGLGDRLMVATFGGFHFIYAAFTWPRGARIAVSASML